MTSLFSGKSKFIWKWKFNIAVTKKKDGYQNGWLPLYPILWNYHFYNVKTFKLLDTHVLKVSKFPIVHRTVNVAQIHLFCEQCWENFGHHQYLY